MAERIDCRGMGVAYASKGFSWEPQLGGMA